MKKKIMLDLQFRCIMKQVICLKKKYFGFEQNSLLVQNDQNLRFFHEKISFFQKVKLTSRNNN